MGRSSSKLLGSPNNPLQEIQFEESKREQRKRKKEKEQKQIAKLQKKHARKNKNKKNNSKNSVTKQNSSSQRMDSFEYQPTTLEINKDEFNRQIENKIKTNLDTDLTTFVLNQISLTLQFLANNESEITSISEELLCKENDFNQNLEEHSILLTNPLDAAVAKWIQYKPVHGPDKNNTQPLQTQAMYVVFENIDIARPNDANYDSISPLCKVDMETDFYQSTPCKEEYVDTLREIKWKGYMRLKLREDPRRQRQVGHTGEEIYTDVSSGYSTTSGYSTKAASTTGSGGYGSETNYDYAYIAHLNTHHPLSELKMTNQRDKCQLDAKVLPESCVSSLGNFVEPWIEDDTDDENDDEDEEYDEDGYSSADDSSRDKYKDYETIEAIKRYKLEQERRKLLLSQRYLNSKEFMSYFGELMRKKLAQKLLIPAEELTAATYRGSSIYTNQFEIIPAIHVAQNAQSWPDCAFQFRIRERPITTNPLTGQQFQWPTRSMIKRIETFGFHVIPMGYAPKRQRNPFRELEWRIVFPKAERYLERHLTSTQVKVFMMTKTLVKTFVEPQEKNKALMFAIDHLRMHLFWECERNFTAWPEEFLGEVLVRFIHSFMQRLREKCLRDYFIEERNLFESIPEYSLVTLYSILADITANPLMHLMVAFRNLDFAINFFPKLHFKKLFDVLAENEMMKLKMQAKNSRNMTGIDSVEDEPLLMADEGAKGLVGMRQHREKTNGKLRRKTHLMRHNIEVKKKLDFELRRVSVESIDVEFFFSKNMLNCQSKLINQGVENLRRTNLLEIILDHLMAMTEKAVDLHSVYTAKVLLAQARRLCKFYHNYGCDLGAKEYLATIHSIDEDVTTLYQSIDCSLMPPALPIRTSVEPVKPCQTEKPESSKANVYVEVMHHSENCARDETTPNTKRSLKFRQNESAIEECEERLGNIYIGQPNSAVNSPAVRKSIKFTNHVVEVHKGDTNPMQKPEGYSPAGILRFDSAFAQEESTESNSDMVDDKIHEYEEDIKPNDNNNDNNNSTSSFWNKFGSSAGILKNMPISNSMVMKSLASSTEKVLTTMSAEEKRVQLREMLKRKTVLLKGAFNQSSES